MHSHAHLMKNLMFSISYSCSSGREFPEMKSGWSLMMSTPMLRTLVIG